MSDVIERDDRGREIMYVNRIPDRPQWNKPINNLVEQGMMDRAMQCTRDMMNLGIEPDIRRRRAKKRRF